MIVLKIYAMVVSGVPIKGKDEKEKALENRLNYIKKSVESELHPFRCAWDYYITCLAFWV